MPQPALGQRTMRLAVHRIEDSTVQLDKGSGLELGSRVRQRGSRHRLRWETLLQLEEKLMRVSLQRLQTFLEQEEHENGKGQFAFACEIGGTPPMPRAEIRSHDPLTQTEHELERALSKGNVVLHPQCTSRLYLLCTFNSFTLYSSFIGSGDRG